LPWCAETYGGISQMCIGGNDLTHVIIDNQPIGVVVENVDGLDVIVTNTEPIPVDIDNEPINVTVTNGLLSVDILNQPISVSFDETPTVVMSAPMLGFYELPEDPVGVSRWAAVYSDTGVFPATLSKAFTDGGPLVEGQFRYRNVLTEKVDFANIFNHMDMPDEQTVAISLTDVQLLLWEPVIRAEDEGYVPITYEPIGPIYARRTQQQTSEMKHPDGFVQRFIRYFQFVYPYAKDALEEEMFTIPPDLQLQANITTNNTGEMVSDSSKSDTISPAMYSMGESVMSIRSLMKMFTRTGYISNFITSLVDADVSWRPNGFTIYPQVVRPSVSITTCTEGSIAATGSGINSNAVSFYHYPDLLDIMSLMYGFSKGSVRLKVSNMLGGVASCSVSMRSSQTLSGDDNTLGDNVAFPMADSFQSFPVETGSDAGKQTFINSSNFEFYVGNDVEARNLQLQLPFYKNLVMYRIDKDILWDNQDMYNEAGFWRMPSNAISIVYDYSTDGDAQMHRHQRFDVYRAIADDFSYHLLQGLPPMVCTNFSRNGGAPALNPIANTTRF
jgi:hypothetical protein